METQAQSPQPHVGSPAPPPEVDEGAAAGPSNRVSLTTNDGRRVYMDELDVPASLKKVLAELDFEGSGTVTEAHLDHTVGVISAMRKGLDADGSGSVSFQEMMDGVKLLANIKAATRNNSGELDYTYMPEKVQQVMKEWDADGSGKVSHHELAAAAKAHHKIQQEGRLMKKIIFAMAIVILALMVSMFVLSYLAVEMAKEMRGDNSGMMKNAEGEVVKMGSSDYVMEGGKLVPRDSVEDGGNTSRRLMGTDGVSQPVTMSTAQTTFGISSRMSNKMLTELTSFTLELNNGDSRLIRVASWQRKPQPGAHHCGSVVVLKSSEHGFFTLDDTDIYYDGTDEDILEKYGAENDEVIAAWKDDPDDLENSRRLSESKGRQPVRRLSEAARNGHIKGRRLSAAAMAGMYNSIASADEEFDCIIMMDDGTEVVITPPEPPVVPYTMVTEYEHKCIMGKEDHDVCHSSLDGTIGELRPGVTKHPDGTFTVRSFQQVLMLQDSQVMVSYFPSHFMQRKVQVWDYTTKKKRSYSLFGKNPNSTEKLHCAMANMTPEEVTGKDSKPIDLSYLGMVKDGTMKQYMRWNVAPKGAKTRPGETSAAMELWEDALARVPYRMFMPGPTEIAPNVKAAIFFAPMKIRGFKQNLTEAEVKQWLKTTVDAGDGSGPKDIISDLLESCTKVKEVMVTGTTPMKVPTPSGPYSEGAAFWYGDRLTEMSSTDFDEFMQGPLSVGEHFAWPDSFANYWRKMKAARSDLRMHKEMLQKLEGCSQTGSSSRRLSGEMYRFVLPSWVSKVLFGEGNTLEFGAGNGCLLGRITRSAQSKPKWAETMGVDIDVEVSLQYCYDPSFSLDGHIFIQLTKGVCIDLPWFVPTYNMAAMYLTGFFRIIGGSPIVENCEVKEHGYLIGRVEVEALVGIYNDDDSWRWCICEYCDPANWPNYGEDQKAQCGCERFAPSVDEDRRRSLTGDYLGDDSDTWKLNFEEQRRRRGDQRRRRRREGDSCPFCYQNAPAYDIGADINAQFNVYFDEFTPGSDGVDITGEFGVTAKARVFGMDWEVTLIEDYTLFSANNVFQLGGSVCARRLDVTNTSAETVDDHMIATSWLCTDECSHANDGHCDDGGVGSKFSLCALGTDCNDCGTRAMS